MAITNNEGRPDDRAKGASSEPRVGVAIHGHDLGVRQLGPDNFLTCLVVPALASIPFLARILFGARDKG